MDAVQAIGKRGSMFDGFQNLAGEGLAVVLSGDDSLDCGNEPWEFAVKVRPMLVD